MRPQAGGGFRRLLGRPSAGGRRARGGFADSERHAGRVFADQLLVGVPREVERPGPAPERNAVVGHDEAVGLLGRHERYDVKGAAAPDLRASTRQSDKGFCGLACVPGRCAYINVSSTRMYGESANISTRWKKGPSTPSV